MARELVQARADADTVDGIEEYAEERDISRSEAIRRLLRAGLAVEKRAAADSEEGADDRYVVVDENGHVIETTTAEEWAAGEELSQASIMGAVRIIGGAMIGLAALAFLLTSIGVL